jgi:hypothetical protein
MRMGRLLGVLVGCLAGAACGGGAGAGDGTPLPGDEAAALCDDACAHAVSCAWETDAAACTSACTSLAPMFRGDGYREWVECLAAAACTTENAGEACYLDAVGAVATRPDHETYASQCTAAQAQCPGLPAGVCDIDQVVLFSDAYMQSQVLPCLQMACDALAACLEERVLDAF